MVSQSNGEISMSDKPWESHGKLWAHCVAEHCCILSPEISWKELKDFHDHEHHGPGTIRNHDLEDRTYTLKKIGKVLSESEI